MALLDGQDIEELKQKLLYTTIELESVRLEASEEVRRNKENIKQLHQLLKVASQERDEAKDQLHKLLNNSFIISPSNPITEFTPILPQTLTRAHLINPAKKSNSRSITESNSSSPVDSLFESVSSPELSTININDSTNIAYVNQPFVQDYSDSALVPKIDQFSGVIESLVKGKSLPQKGKFLQAVMEAGPLLQTLLVAGPLPRWRNPPPPLQPFHIPPVTIKGCENESVSEKGQSYVEMSCGSTQMMSMNVLSFGNGGSGSCNYILNGKRQRI